MRRPESAPGAVPGKRLYRFLFLLAVLTALLLSLQRFRPRPPSPGALPPTGGSAVDAATLAEFNALEAAEAEADRTVWSAEHRAQERARVVEQFWNDLRATADPLALLARAPFRSLVHPPPAPAEPAAAPHRIARHRWSGPPSVPVTTAEWTARLNVLRGLGWQLDQSEWRHTRFLPASPTNAESSWYDVRLDLSRTNPVTRAQLQARVRFEWPPESRGGGSPDRPSPVPEFGDVTVETADLLERTGDLPFRTTVLREINPFPRTSWIDPLIVADLDHDGTPEILLVARNLVLRRQADGTWNETLLSSHHPGLLFTALLADFDRDGRPDLLMAVRGGLVLLRGDATGRFETAAEPVWTAPEKLHYAQAFTCGDIDGDGDLDVFLGQYRTPYEGGQMPRPYFDANDGPPAYLLRNDGRGHFEDATAGSGLEARRHRRSYGASFVDLDSDGDLDLVVTSDFAGMDVHANDGHGHFTERTAAWLDEAKGFGMSHTFADFDADGRLDILMVGMPQPTADRLNALGVERPGFEAWGPERQRMVVGNRLFFGGAEGYRQRPIGRGVARAGWAWSAAAFDLDHERFPALHVVNGHETRQSVRDYESEFWTQDIYVGASVPRAAVDAFFAAKFSATRARGWSYGGHDKNRLYLDLGGTEFLEVGHLFGLALEADSRNTVADDLDGDGDLDLVTTTFEIWPQVRQTLRIFENRLPVTGHWIGVALPEAADAPSPIGATVTIRDRMGSQIRAVTIGDGYRSQVRPIARFGLGDVTQVNAVDVRWPGGTTVRMGPLPVDRVHRAPAPSPAQ